MCDELVDLAEEATGELGVAVLASSCFPETRSASPPPPPVLAATTAERCGGKTGPWESNINASTCCDNSSSGGHKMGKKTWRTIARLPPLSKNTAPANASRTSAAIFSRGDSRSLRVAIKSKCHLSKRRFSAASSPSFPSGSDVALLWKARNSPLSLSRSPCILSQMSKFRQALRAYQTLFFKASRAFDRRPSSQSLKVLNKISVKAASNTASPTNSSLS
mmetsp:Transcript_66873/g.193211  ORF Transcript_66873/g.193211 Transcript_66873/m.193211 type:complete len:220 (-) Transcript_66873:2736-3395(-)